MEIRELENGRAADWDHFVRETPGSVFFQLSGWKDVVESSFHHRTHYLEAVSNGAIVGVLPLVHMKSLLFGNGLISNAFCVGGGPLSTSRAVCQALVGEAQELMKKVGADYLELRDTQIDDVGWSVNSDLYANFERTIESDPEADLKKIPRKQRAVLRKAMKDESLDCHIDQTIDRFYDLYALSVRNLGTPVLSKKFFRQLRDVFGQDCEILTVTQDNLPVSSVLSFYFRDRVLPYYTGSVTHARRIGSNDLMYWHVMRRAAERGYSVFDFGRSKSGTGPYAFKKNWGFEPRPMPQAYFVRDGEEPPNLNPTNPKYRLFISMWQRLPLPVANLVGPHIISRIG